MPKPEGKRSGSRPSILAAFFLANPNEELSLRDIATKLSCDRTEAGRIVLKLIRTKRADLESVHVVRLRAKGIAKESA